jgi:outer membrane protein TolC
MDTSAVQAESTRGTLDRAAYVRAVLRENPGIEAARQGWRAAVARIRQAGRLEDPMVDVGFAPLSIGSSEARFGYEVSVTQKLPWFGKRSLEADAAAAEAAASKNDLEATRRELALTAVELYDEYFVATRALEINGRHLELVRAFRDGATAQFESGRGSAEDPLRAESELARLERDAAVLGSRRDVVAAQMNELLHRAPETPLAPPAELPDADAAAVGDARGLQKEAVSRRPDVVAVRQRAHAEQLRADRASREYYPDVAVSASYNSMWDMPEHRFMVGLGLNIPIWTGARGGARDEATAMRAQLEAEASRLEAAARTQVYVSLKQLDESARVLRLYEQRLLPVARDEIDAARAAFTASRTSFTAVIEAERNLRSVELDHEMARAECDRRRAELERALGRMPGLGGEGAPDGR